MDYSELNRMADGIPIGSEGLVILPYGNGSERTLENRNPGAAIRGLNFNIHQRPHLIRAALEGIAFALQYGNEILKSIGLDVKRLKAGKGNLFLSPVFSATLASISGSPIELLNTDGSQAAARGAGLGVGHYRNYEEALLPVKTEQWYEPDLNRLSQYVEAYGRWKETLLKELASP